MNVIWGAHCSAHFECLSYHTHTTRGIENFLLLSSEVMIMGLYGGRESSTRCNFRKHANRKSTSKSRKHFHNFDSRWCQCTQHKQYLLFAARFFFWLCCEHLQRMCCQINLQVFFLCAARWALSATVGACHSALVMFKCFNVKKYRNHCGQPIHSCPFLGESY